MKTCTALYQQQGRELWHPDIEEFIAAKSEEERKAHALIAAGWDGSFNGPGHQTVRGLRMPGLYRPPSKGRMVLPYRI